jgi:hypothetical protein
MMPKSPASVSTGTDQAGPSERMMRPSLWSFTKVEEKRRLSFLAGGSDGRGGREEVEVACDLVFSSFARFLASALTMRAPRTASSGIRRRWDRVKPRVAESSGPGAWMEAAIGLGRGVWSTVGVLGDLSCAFRSLIRVCVGVFRTLSGSSLSHADVAKPRKTGACSI